MFALPSACLIGDEGTKAGDNLNKVKTLKVGHDLPDIFVVLRGFFIDQSFILTNDPSAQICAGQIGNFKFMRQVRFGITAFPFASRAVGQGLQGDICVLCFRRNQIGKRTSGAGDNYQTFVRRAQVTA